VSINKYHIYFWLFFLSFYVVLDYLQYGEDFSMVRELYMAFMQISIFYTYLFAITNFRKGGFWIWARSFCFFLLSFGFILFLNYLRGRLAIRYGYTLHETFGKLLNDTIGIYIAIAFYATGYYYLNRSRQKEKQLRQLSEAKAAQDVANAELMKEKAAQDIANAQLRQSVLELENSFLRAQINPHFLYNTLNWFYVQAVPSNKKLAEGLLTLADIMRYSLETIQGSPLVPLKMEVEQLRRVIAMHQMRFENGPRISFTAEGTLGDIQVAPLIFITLLENALKHGDVNDPDEPISLWLAVDSRRIYFTIRNKKSEGTKAQGHGIGLGNVKKRLQAAYGSRYDFGIEEKEGRYHVAMAIEHWNGE
jgi:sensor histidine kinase YesM